jgi:hypothetical protein
LEERLDAMEAWLRVAGKRTEGCWWVNDLEPGRQQHLHTSLEATRSLLDETFRALGHPPEPVSVFQRLQASIGLNWEDSLELRALRIRNYGPLDDEAANALDRLSETLSDHFHRMRQDLGNPGTSHDA